MLADQAQTATELPRRQELIARGIPGVAAVGVFLAWAYTSGGYFPSAWYPGALFLTAMLAVALAAWPALLGGLGRATQVAVVAFAAFTVWSYASITWADVKGDAWDGANRTALYLIVFAIFALWRWSVPAGLILLAVFAVGISAIGLSMLIVAGHAGDVGAHYNDTRFTAPVGYVNGNAALFVLGFWPALFLASRRELPILLRPLFLAAAGVCVQLAVLPQSRGAAVAFALLMPFYFAVVPDRMRSLAFLLPVALVFGAALPRLLDAGAETEPAALAAGARSAASAILVSAVALFALGVVLAVGDRRIEIPARVRNAAAAAVGAFIVVAAVAAVVLAASLGDPAARVRAAWADVTQELAGGSRPSYLLSGLETNRPDLWRVAFEQFREHPVRGIGVENFSVAYVRERRSDEETLYPHSLPLQVLSQTGLVGAALFVSFVAAALSAAFANRRRQRGLPRGVSAVAIVVFASWLVHGSIDWLWQLPALAAPALAFLALAGSVERPDPQQSQAVPRGLNLALVAILAVASVSFVLPWLSVRQSGVAATVWRADPSAAAAAIERARRLNPLTDRPDLIAGAIARRRQDWDGMVRAYERAVTRNPHSWYAHLHLALALAKRGDVPAARREVRVARRLNPTERVVLLVHRWLETGETIDVEAVAEALAVRYERVTR